MSTQAAQPSRSRPVVRPVVGPVVQQPVEYGAQAGPLAVAHRGGAGLAPENTLAAFRLAYALGVRYLETDVRVTADGVCAVFHDAHLGRVTGTRGRVSAQPWSRVRRLRVGGEPIPRLEELLEEFPDARISVDLKDRAAIEPLAAVLRPVRSRVCVAGASDRWLAAVRAACGPGLTTSMGWESLTLLAAAARCGTRPRGVVRAPFVHVPVKLGRVTVFADRLVAMAHDLGTRVLVWTVDEPALMHRLLDAGVDGVITDRPDLLREVLVARGSWRTT